MPTIHDPCKPGCCKTPFDVCAKYRDCGCHQSTDSRQKSIDDWEEQPKKAQERS